jgi:hypothetical protein
MSVRKPQAGDIRQIAAATLAGSRRAEMNAPSTRSNRTAHDSIEALRSRIVKHQKARNLLNEADFSPNAQRRLWGTN